MHHKVKKVLDRLVHAGLADESAVEGCADAEITVIESHYGVRLPSAYRDFLSAMGKSAGKFLVGTDYSCSKLLGFHDDAVRLLKQQRVAFSLPESVFVFAFHQGYTFLYFDAALEGDPPVWMFTEGEKEPKQIARTFSEWLASALEADIEAYAELGEI